MYVLGCVPCNLSERLLNKSVGKLFSNVINESLLNGVVGYTSSSTFFRDGLL